MNAAISSWRAWMNSIMPSRAVERAHEAVDAVAGITVDAPDAPFVQALNKKSEVSPLGLLSVRWKRNRGDERVLGLP